MVLVLQDELEEVGVSQSALAAHIAVLPKTVNEICLGKHGISSEMAWKLPKPIGKSPQFWLNLQTNRELSQGDKRTFEGVMALCASV